MSLIAWHLVGWFNVIIALAVLALSRLVCFFVSHHWLVRADGGVSKQTFLGMTLWGVGLCEFHTTDKHNWMMPCSFPLSLKEITKVELQLDPLAFNFDCSLIN